MGILYIYQNAQPTGLVWSSFPYFSISLSLNILLTLMIVIRLTVHARNVRTAMGGAGSGGLCKAIVTMFIESCAIYAVTSSLVLGLLSAGNGAANIFTPILAETQVRALLQSQSLDGSSNNGMMDWTGHRSTVCHSSSRQQERIDEQKSRLRTYEYVQSREPRGVDGR